MKAKKPSFYHQIANRFLYPGVLASLSEQEMRALFSPKGLTFKDKNKKQWTVSLMVVGDQSSRLFVRACSGDFFEGAHFQYLEYGERCAVATCDARQFSASEMQLDHISTCRPSDRSRSQLFPFEIALMQKGKAKGKGSKSTKLQFDLHPEVEHFIKEKASFDLILEEKKASSKVQVHFVPSMDDTGLINAEAL